MRLPGSRSRSSNGAAKSPPPPGAPPPSVRPAAPPPGTSLRAGGPPPGKSLGSAQSEEFIVDLKRRREQLVAEDNAAPARTAAAKTALTQAEAAGDQVAIAEARAEYDRIESEGWQTGRDCRDALVDLHAEIVARNLAHFDQMERTNAAGDAITAAFQRRQATPAEQQPH